MDQYLYKKLSSGRRISYTFELYMVKPLVVVVVVVVVVATAASCSASLKAHLSFIYKAV